MYRKFTANFIFTGKDILPGDSVLIANENGTIVDLVAFSDAGDGIENFSGMLCPGFVNAHCHLELSHMKGHISVNTGLTDFILKVVFERNAAEAIILSAIEKAEKEMLANGIVAVGDICNTAITLAQKSKQQLQYHNFVETSGFISAIAAGRFESSAAIYTSFSELQTANSIVPHAPYSVSPELFTLINQYPNNKILSIHNQETAAENELFQNKEGDFLSMYQQMNINISSFSASGKSSLQTYLPSLNHYQSLILVHNVCTGKKDIEFEKKHTQQLTTSTNFNQFQPSSTSYCLCPNANLYITGQLPPVDRFIQQQCQLVLGTDSLASNHQLSILEEIKTLQKYFAHIPLETMLQWATINGAKALQMADSIGSFDKGKTPGILHINHLNEGRLTSNSTASRIL